MESKQTLSVFCWNISNPSKQRAELQISWLKNRREDVLVLTETKDSIGCHLIKEAFEELNYNVVFPEPVKGEYGVMILSRYGMRYDGPSATTIPSRLALVRVRKRGCTFRIAGIYVPSNDRKPEKMKRKRDFISSLSRNLKNHGKHRKTIFCGDFNVLEPDHFPIYSMFRKWEYSFYNDMSNQFIDAFRSLNPDKRDYSWFGRKGNGYRYDHCFVSFDVEDSLRECFYAHEPRNLNLSDHSAMLMSVNL